MRLKRRIRVNYYTYLFVRSAGRVKRNDHLLLSLPWKLTVRITCQRARATRWERVNYPYPCDLQVPNALLIPEALDPICSGIAIAHAGLASLDPQSLKVLDFHWYPKFQAAQNPKYEAHTNNITCQASTRLPPKKPHCTFK